MRSTNYKIKRTFHPVGHGGFYTENFLDDEFTIVYDCGAKKKKNLISLLDNEFKSVKKIDILFISHFHADHINGLKHILNTCTVKYLVLPLLDDEEKIRIFLFNRINEATIFIQDLCLSPKSTVKKTSEATRVVLVSPEVSDDEFNINDLPSKISSGDNLVYSNMHNTLQWNFIPFNFKYKDRSEKLKEIFSQNKIPLNISSFQKFYKKNKQNQKKVIDAYNKVQDDFNTNSLTLYSGLFSLNNISSGYCKRGYSPEKFHMTHNKSGCLYLGDYNAKKINTWEALKDAYSSYFQLLSIIQIPHHGSKENYNEALNTYNNLLSVISAPFKNDKHPNPNVLKKIILNHGIPIIVTENDESIFIQILSISK